VARETTLERTCIVTRRRAPPEAMIRFVCAPDGALAPDIRSRLPGRGVWVTARADLVAQAARKQVFARQLKASVKASPDLAAEVDRLLEADCLQSLSMANKAGLVIMGFGKVSAALEKGGIAALIEASDGGPDGKRKIAQTARRSAASEGDGVRTIVIFTSSQLDLALGRTNVIHAALAKGRPADAFLARCRRLLAYRGEIADETACDDHNNSFGEAGAASRMNIERTGVDPESDYE
jgi:predicted RNA-binding protein YlxR (DUF448 family)